MTSELLSKICEPGSTNLDLLIDELNDYLECAALGRDEINIIVERLSELLVPENDSAVWESVFNLFGSLSGRKVLNERIANIAIKYLSSLPPGCLVHAIPIIAESNRLDKKGLVSAFLNSTNVAVKNIAFKYIQEI